MTTTLELAARLVPLPPEQREAVLARIPKDRSHVSQLADSFDGSWYLHRGDLVVDGDFDSTLHLVVDGDLTVRGTLSDDTQQALLVVTGDLLCRHLFSRQLLVVLGSLLSTGVVYADYNDFAFEVWGEALEARALLLEDKSSLLPARREVELEVDSEVLETKGDPARLFAGELLRFVDAAGNLLFKVEEDGVARWVDEAGEPLDEEASRAVEVARVLPADFDTLLEAIRAGEPVFLPQQPAPARPWQWRLDADAPAEIVLARGESPDPRVRVSAASHPAASRALVARLARDGDARVRAAAAHHPALAEEAAAALARDAEDDVRRQLAASPHAAPHLALLAADASAEVRRAVASHPALDDAARRALVSDPDRGVKARALRYLPVTAAWVAELRGSADALHGAWAIEHAGDVPSQGAPAAGWRQDLLDPRRAVREAALRSARDARVLPFLAEHRARFVTDESPALRQALAAAARDAGTLAVLARDADPYVRRTALDNLAAPGELLLAEAERLAAAPASSWTVSAPEYADHISEVNALLAHPRLPAAALRLLHGAYPAFWRLEPRRDMPLDVILARAESLTPSLAFEPEVAEWRRQAEEGDGHLGPVFAALLSTGDGYLESAARMSPLVPLELLLAHARGLGDDPYALEEVASNPRLGEAGPEAEALRELLLAAAEDGVDRALAKNPDLPASVLARLLERAPAEAPITLWQAHGEVR